MHTAASSYYFFSLRCIKQFLQGAAVITATTKFITGLLFSSMQTIPQKIKAGRSRLTGRNDSTNNTNDNDNDSNSNSNSNSNSHITNNSHFPGDLSICSSSSTIGTTASNSRGSKHRCGNALYGKFHAGRRLRLPAFIGALSLTSCSLANAATAARGGGGTGGGAGATSASAASSSSSAAANYLATRSSTLAAARRRASLDSVGSTGSFGAASSSSSGVSSGRRRSSLGHSIPSSPFSIVDVLDRSDDCGNRCSVEAVLGRKFRHQRTIISSGGESGGAAAFAQPRPHPASAAPSDSSHRSNRRSSAPVGIRAADDNNDASSASTASTTSKLSMKRAPSPAAAFVSTLRRSFASAAGPSPSASSTSLRASAAPTTPSSERKHPHNEVVPMNCRPPLAKFRESFSHSWIASLSPEDPENYERSLAGGRRGSHPGRPVFNGHYVSVRPAPLKNPKLVVHSPELLAELGFREDEARSGPFVRYFSGDVDGAFFSSSADDDDGATSDAPGPDADDAGTSEEKEIETWATPYALSIMGRRYTNNCPYGTGDGYGDGRAISVGEILVPKAPSADGEAEVEDGGRGEGPGGGEDDAYPARANRYELQLKGAGQTPFCRGADGRAVLRSSAREFLASEAMHHLGVSTTRALSLIVSDGPDGDVSTRPWYSESARSRDLPKMDDPRLSKYSDAQRREIISQLAAQAKSDPDMLMEEKCAITTRVAPSFVRIGHLDLFARRVEMLAMKSDDDPQSIKETSRYKELEDMMWHACYREYHSTAYAPYFDKQDAKSAALALMEGAMKNISKMVGGWIRVGFVQGNFNADNCLVGGRTMDYGPFGFLDVYHPLSAKWTGSGDHFGFMNQPNAGYANFAVLVESLLPIIDAEGGNSDEVRDEILKKAQDVFSTAVDEAMKHKLGLVGGGEEMDALADELWGEIEPLLRTARGDWTLFWRQLTYVAAAYPPDSTDYDGMVAALLGKGEINPFYDALSDENKAILRGWIEKWHKALAMCREKLGADATPPEETMRLSNPKYVLREWMLVDAYTKADPGKSPGNPFPALGGDYSGIRELFELIKDPYGEGSAEQHQRYYRRAPDESLKAGGTAFMS